MDENITPEELADATLEIQGEEEETEGSSAAGYVVVGTALVLTCVGAYVVTKKAVGFAMDLSAAFADRRAARKAQKAEDVIVEGTTEETN